MAGITTQRLNELLQQVIEERNLANGWTTFDVPTQEFDPYHILTEREVTVEDVLEEGIGGLWDPDDDQRVRLGTWGTALMPNTMWSARLSTPEMIASRDPQPSYDFECYQCGRPITLKGLDRWTDHAGRSTCDLALVEQAMLDTGSYWTDHHPKPFYGEEQE